jgi:hypothetical protein
MFSSSNLGNGNKVSLVDPGDDTILIVRNVLDMGSSEEPVDKLGLRVPEMLEERVGLIPAVTLTVTGIDGGCDDDLTDKMTFVFAL